MLRKILKKKNFFFLNLIVKLIKILKKILIIINIFYIKFIYLLRIFF